MNAEQRQVALNLAVAGDEHALGELLQSYRPYIRVLARALERGRLHGRLGESDLVQDSLLEAHRAFPNFRGTTLPEFVGWLRQVVIGAVSRTLRGHLATGK